MHSCGSPAPGAMVGGLRGFLRRGRRSYKKSWMQTSLGRIKKRGGNACKERACHCAGAMQFCGSPAPGAMGSGLRGFSRRGRRSYKKSWMQTSLGRIKKWAATPARKGPVIAQAQCSFVGAPPPGRWVVVCEAFRDGGVAPTKKVDSNIVGPDQAWHTCQPPWGVFIEPGIKWSPPLGQGLWQVPGARPLRRPAARLRCESACKCQTSNQKSGLCGRCANR